MNFDIRKMIKVYFEVMNNPVAATAVYIHFEQKTGKTVVPEGREAFTLSNEQSPVKR